MGDVPTNLKLAKVVPIYKGKDRKLFNHNIPVSLLPCISKVLEKVIHKRLYSFLQLSDIFFIKVSMDFVQTTVQLTLLLSCALTL